MALVTFIDGFSTALVVAALIAFAGAIVAAVMVRARPRLEAAGPVEVAA